MTKATRSRGMPRRTSQPASQSNRTRWILIGGAAGVVAVAAVIAIVLTLGSSGGPPEPAVEPLVITGQPLPELPAEGPDPAVGMTVMRRARRLASLPNVHLRLGVDNHRPSPQPPLGGHRATPPRR